MRYIFLIIILLLSLSGIAQDKHEQLDLDTILRKLEEAHQIKFSYQPGIVSAKEIKTPSWDKDLDLILKEIAQKARIKFTAINQRYFVITKAESVQLARIQGLVIDSLNQISLPVAHIYNVSQQKGTTTNLNGEFTLLNVNDNDWIEIRFMGYKKKKLKVFDILNDSIIFLTPNNINLSEVLVNNYVSRGFYRNKNGSFSIDLNAIQAFAGLSEPDILETIQNIPGIHSPDESASSIHFRGGTPDQNLILWDGIKVYQTGHFAGTFSAFNPFVVENVLIEKSGTSAKFGNRISGLIDINTASKIPEKLHMGIGSTLNHADFFLKTPVGKKKKKGIVLSFRRSFNDWIATTSSNQYEEKTFQNVHIIDLNRENKYASKHNKNYNYHDFNFKIINEYSPTNRLITSILNNQNNIDYSIHDTYYADYTKDKMNINNWGFNMEWEHTWNNRLKQTTQLRATDYSFRFNAEYLFNEEFVTELVKENDITDVDLQTYMDWEISPTLKSVIGYQANLCTTSFLLAGQTSIEEEPYIALVDSGNDLNHSLYNEYTLQLKDRTYFNAGIRSSYYALGKHYTIEPRLKIEYSLTKHLRYRISAESKTQSINQIVEFATEAFGLEDQLWTLSDGADFPFIKSKQISTGLLYTPQKWQIDIDLYYKRIDNISTFTRGFSGNEDNTAHGRKTITGVDCLLKKQIRNLGVFASYSWMNAKLLFSDLNAGEKFPDNFDIRHKLYVAGNLKWNKINFALGWKFHTGKPYTHFSKSIDFYYGDENYPMNTKRLPNYHRLDFSTNYTLRFKKDYQHKLRISFALQNIYNRKNLINRSYLLYNVSDEKVNEVLQINRRGLMLTPNLSVRYWF